jgi:hypothetical protein
MTRLALIIRFLFFGVFFLVGVGAIVLSIIAEPELVNYYKSRKALVEIQEQNAKIIDLTQQYATQMTLIESEPNILERFIPLTFGQKPQAPDTAFPQVQDPTLQTETEILLERIESTPDTEPIPTWLDRVIDPSNRRGLFGAGAGLIMVTFIFFGLNKDNTL